jgi:transcriptional regulator with XRE-family HTH domain
MPAQEITPSTFLVQELRAARTGAGLSQEELGRAINYSGSLVSAVENGQRPPTREYVTAVDRALDNGGFFERFLNNIVSLDQAPVWLRDWIVFEREATMLRWFEQSVIPGLLQTEAYARALLKGGSLLTDAEIERVVGSRLDRQSILSQPEPPTFIAIIDENVLHREIGDASIMAGQCEHLLARAAEPHIQLHVIPASVGAHAGMGGPFIIATGSEIEAGHLDNALQAQIVDQRTAVDRLVRRWEAVRGEALPRSQTAMLIKEVTAKWQT